MIRLLAALALGCAGPDDDAPSPTDPPHTDVGADTGPPAWGPPREVSLRLTDTPPPELTLELDRDAVARLFGPAAADVVLLEVDPIPMLTTTLDRIKTACGTDWQRDVREPVYDCTLTELGRTFTGADGTWRSSPELALIRILTMTPANADVRGTSVAALADIADALGLGGGFGQILADALQIGRTEEFIHTAPIAQAMRDHLLATHPALGPGGALPITLEDALTDLATLGPRLGARGAHPGVVDPTFPTRGVILTDDFAMHAVVRSNLRVLDGLDLSHGKDYVGLIVDTTGPTRDDEVEFDFDDPARFQLRGLADAPTVDLRIAVREHPRFVPACRGVDGPDCRHNLPGQPLGGPDTAWSVDPWLLEPAIAAAGRLKYAGLRNEACYLGCFSVRIGIGQDRDPAGFARFSVLFSIGNPPPPQYAWELITEVAQVRLHDAGFGDPLPEGHASVAFTLRDLPVGLTGEAAAEAVRPFLQAQSHLISDHLLGDFRKHSGPVDLFYRRTEDGQPTLTWVADGDTGRPWRYARPGLYADEGLTRKVSSTVVPGSDDTTREQWRVAPGDTTLYAADDTGAVYRLDVVAPDLTTAHAEVFVVVRERL